MKAVGLLLLYAASNNNEQEIDYDAFCVIITYQLAFCHAVFIHVHNAIAMQCRDMQSLLVGCMHAHDKIARGQKVGTVSTQLTYGSIVII